MSPNLFLLIGTGNLTALINHAIRITTSPSSGHPSPRLLTHKNTPHQAVNKQKHYPVYP